MNIGAFDIKERYDHLTHANTIFNYLGSLTKGELDEVLLKIEDIAQNKTPSRSVGKKLFNILVEISQNLYNYLENNNLVDKYREIFIFVDKTEQGYKITTGNHLLKKEIPPIKSRIDMVNSLTNEELRHLYRGVLDFGLSSRYGGAGLGIIDLARKSGHNLTYDFEEIDKEFSFFSLEVLVID